MLMSCTKPAQHLHLSCQGIKKVEIIVKDECDRFGSWVGFSRVVLVMKRGLLVSLRNEKVEIIVNVCT